MVQVAKVTKFSRYLKCINIGRIGAGQKDSDTLPLFQSGKALFIVLGRTKGDLRGAGINSGVTSGLVIM